MLVVGGQKLVAGAEPQAARNDVKPDRTIVDVNKIVARSAEIVREFGARMRQPLGSPSRNEIDRFTLKLALPPLIALEDRTGGCAIGTMIEVGDRGVEQKGLPQTNGHAASRLRYCNKHYHARLSCAILDLGKRLAAAVAGVLRHDKSSMRQEIVL